MAIRTLDLKELAAEMRKLRDAEAAQAKIVREGPDGDDTDAAADAAFDEDQQERLDELEALDYQLSGGIKGFSQALVAEDSFEEFAQEQAEELLGTKASAWPLSYVNWEAAADALRQDYKSVRFDDETWWYRSWS